jgi:hypothetical protein
MTATLTDWYRQMQHAAKAEQALIKFEESIGCKRFQDEVICNEEQWEALQKWWHERKNES